MYEFKKTGKVFMSKFLGTGPLSYKKRIYWAVVSQRLRNTALYNSSFSSVPATAVWYTQTFVYTCKKKLHDVIRSDLAR